MPKKQIGKRPTQSPQFNTSKGAEPLKFNDLMTAVVNLSPAELETIHGLSRDVAIGRSPVLSRWLTSIVVGEIARRNGDTVPFVAPDFGAIRAKEAADMLLSCAVLIEGVTHISRVLDVAILLNKIAVCVFGARLCEREAIGAN